MQEYISRILENKKLTSDIYMMTLETQDMNFINPGQFAMVAVRGKFLRRPISVCTFDSDRYTLVYKVVGEGTEIMSSMKEGEFLDALTGLGNGYDIDRIPDDAMLIGGGIGIPPLLGLAQSLVMAGKRFKVLLGYTNVREMFFVNEFMRFSDEVAVMTNDGSYGGRGLVTDAFESCEYACACGPLPMLSSLREKVDEGQFSLEARMACGFGACMGCSIKTADGFSRVCKEGPVFDKNAVDWENLKDLK